MRTKKTTTAFDYETEISTATHTWSSIANRRAMVGLFGRLYLYYRPSTAIQAGALFIVADEETPDPLWRIARPEPIPSNRAYAGVRSWIWEAGRRLPLYPTTPAN